MYTLAQARMDVADFAFHSLSRKCRSGYTPVKEFHMYMANVKPGKWKSQLWLLSSLLIIALGIITLDASAATNGTADPAVSGRLSPSTHTSTSVFPSSCSVPSFGTATNFAVDPNPFSVAVGDF